MSVAPRPPSYRIHKARNCAVVTIHGKNHYLGPFGSPESHEKYARLLTLWHASHGQPLSSAETASSDGVVTVNAVILRYLEFANAYYVKHGKPTGELDNVRGAVKVLKELYGRTPAASFSAKSVSSNCLKYRKPLRLRLLGLKSRKTEPQRCVDSIPAT